eukprot:TRINITY_DN8633_c0_g1_i2.p1 TRINITY_DN8633_c0_g1~~TRINITY_DN8633_c0_g1_i2.p1  ORF type:complete len:586 (+),score=80.53 TRINITY_DN8633_c0_g1_i2:149-1906(+)
MPRSAILRESVNAALALVRGQSVDEPAAVDQAVAKEMDIRRDDFARWITSRSTGICAVILASFINQYLRETWRWVSWEQDVLLVSLSCFLVARQRSSWLTKVANPSCLSSLMMLGCVAWVVFAKPGQFFICTMISVAPRFLFSSTFMRRSLTVCWNALHMAVATYYYATHEDITWITLSTFQIWSLEFISAMMIIVCSEGIHSKTLRSVRDDLENAEMKSGRSAARALLDTVCDASVKLDENLIIAEDAARLGAMLLHSPDRSLKGVEFAQLLSSEKDRETFVKHARARAKLQHQENALADWFHVHVRDSTNNDVEVEVFMVSSQTYGNRTNFLVGIREQAADAIVPNTGKPVEVSFDAYTFEVVGQSSGFVLGGPSGSCDIGDCLHTWLAPCSENEDFVVDLQTARLAVEATAEQFSFASSMVFQDLVKPGTAYAVGHRFLVECSVCVRFENVSSHSAAEDRSAGDSCNYANATDVVGGRGGVVSAEGSGHSASSADEVEGGEAAPSGLEAGRVFAQRRMIANIKLNSIDRIRTCKRNATRKPKLRLAESERPSLTSDRCTLAKHSSVESGSNSAGLANFRLGL